MAQFQIQNLVPAKANDVFQTLVAPDKLKNQLEGLIDVEWENPGIDLKVGAEFAFKMERYGIEQPIRFSVDKYIPGQQLTYHQVTGLFSYWHHTIRVEEHTSTEAKVTDFVEYDIPFGIFGKLADDFVIKKEISKILEHRLQKVSALLSASKKETPDGSPTE